MMDLLGPDGRFHSEFTQCLIATGRTSSKSPNAQNFSPLMKPFFTHLYGWMRTVSNTSE